MKQNLPSQIEAQLCDDILKIIYSYLPHLPKSKVKAKSICRISPNMERDLRLIQSTVLKGKSAMYLHDLDDFVLD